MLVSENAKTVALFATAGNKKLIDELRKKGTNVVLFPAVETEEIALNEPAETVLKNISDFEWIILTDIFAAEYFLLALEKLEIDLFELDMLRICAFGETVADRLRFSQVHSDIITNSMATADALQALQDYESNFANVRVLLPKADELNIEISTELSKIGTDVTELLLYRERISESSQLPKLKALLVGGAIDEFVFSSPEDVASLSVLFPKEKISSLLSETLAIAKSTSAFQALREHEIAKIVSS